MARMDVVRGKPAVDRVIPVRGDTTQLWLCAEHYDAFMIRKVF